MTQRDVAVLKAILDYLHNLDEGQAHELNIHAGASELFMALIPKTEFDIQFATCSRMGWLIRVPTKFKGVFWSISATGEKARLEMQ